MQIITAALQLTIWSIVVESTDCDTNTCECKLVFKNGWLEAQHADDPYPENVYPSFDELLNDDPGLYHNDQPERVLFLDECENGDGVYIPTGWSAKLQCSSSSAFYEFVTYSDSNCQGNIIEVDGEDAVTVVPKVYWWDSTRWRLTVDAWGSRCDTIEYCSAPDALTGDPVTIETPFVYRGQLQFADSVSFNEFNKDPVKVIEIITDDVQGVQIMSSRDGQVYPYILYSLDEAALDTAVRHIIDRVGSVQFNAEMVNNTVYVDNRPTEQPTGSPTTATPTMSPIPTTGNPSIPPTENPSISPTTDPSGTPTGHPSTPPTGNPTVAPTMDPTLSPTQGPSSAPTENPSISLTQNPSISPSEDPSSSPTENPSSSPTQGPSIYPTEDPSISPTDNPSSSPTQSPSISPTQNPSSSPTQVPSISPTEDPSFPPTQSPSISPTEDPSIPPTQSPSISPTEDPSIPPTQAPSLSPSQNPTVSPTKNPTTAPTESPSSSPTRRPTTKPPTESPTKKPTSTASGMDYRVIAAIAAGALIVTLAAGSAAWYAMQPTASDNVQSTPVPVADSDSGSNTSSLNMYNSDTESSSWV